MSDLTILRRLSVHDVPLQDAVTVHDTDSAQRLLQLSEALAAGEVELFARDVAWAHQTHLARDVPPEFLETTVEALHQALVERLPASSTSQVEPYFEVARRELGSTRPAVPASPARCHPYPGPSTLSPWTSSSPVSAG